MPHGRLVLVDAAAVPKDVEAAVLLARYAVLIPACGAPVLFGLFASRAAFARWSQLVGGVAGALAASSVVVVSITARLSLPALTEGAFHYALIALAVVVMAIQTMLTLRFIAATLATIPACVAQVALWPWLGFREDLKWYGAFWLISAMSLGMLGSYMLDSLRRRNFLQRIEIDAERARSEELLHNILPAAIVGAAEARGAPIADQLREVSVLFADIVGFTDFAAAHPRRSWRSAESPSSTAFDDIVERRGLEKIKTIGDAYMVGGGHPDAARRPRRSGRRPGAEMIVVTRRAAYRAR